MSATSLSTSNLPTYRKMAVSATPNDSGIVLLLFLMMATLAYAVISVVSLYASAAHHRARLLCGWANVSNATVHVFLVLLLIVDQGKVSLDVSVDIQRGS